MLRVAVSGGWKKRTGLAFFCMWSIEASLMDPFPSPPEPSLTLHFSLTQSFNAVAQMGPGVLWAPPQGKKGSCVVSLSVFLGVQKLPWVMQRDGVKGQERRNGKCFCHQTAASETTSGPCGEADGRHGSTALSLRPLPAQVS